MNKIRKYNIILITIISILILLVILKFINNIFQESFDNNDNNIEVVISRYNEDLNWLTDNPFNKYNYIVYNKGENDNYFKSDKFKKEIKLKNVGRESHTYLTHIIDNYDNNQLSDFTIFVPGSVELDHKYERTKRLFIEAGNNVNSDLFSCTLFDQPVKDKYYDFQIDQYLSTNKNNAENNVDSNVIMSDIRPYGKWYEHTFKDANSKSTCFTQNAIFGLTKETILKKPKSYYIDLVKQVSDHSNHETGHFFERSWETVFFPYSSVKYVY